MAFVAIGSWPKYCCNFNTLLQRCISPTIPNKLYCSDSGQTIDSEAKSNLDNTEECNDIQTADYPEEPTTCCMSGCPNCVWLEYAEKLSAYYKDGGERAVAEINEKVTDANIKSFLLHEIRMQNVGEAKT